jgi:4-hydroxybenzoate polyprenyltransferase
MTPGNVDEHPRDDLRGSDSLRPEFTGYEKFHAYLELVRLPNVFTAVADVLMGFLFVRDEFGPRDGWGLGLLIVASSLLYMAGIVLNDVFDYAIDFRQRPERPLPSGRIARGTARRLGWTMLAGGVILAAAAALVVGQARTAVVGVLLAACVVLYDAWLKRTPLGPVAMGGCRMLNVLLGMSAAGFAWQAVHWLVAGAIGGYVAGVTWLARSEAGRSHRLHLAGATAVMMAAVALLASLPRWTAQVAELLQVDPTRWYLILGVLGILIGWRCLRAIADPVPATVQMAVRQSIFSLVILDAVACFAVRGTTAAIVVVLLLVPALILGQWLEST